MKIKKWFKHNQAPEPKYPMTIVCKDKNGRVYELFSNVTIKRKKRFYRLDDEGYYFIPEVFKKST